MSTLTSFGIRNLRSFGSEKQLIPVKPINIFVGKNSCGKSTFLRTYPLLRQSVEADTRSPILWYGGYNGYVDFGDFETALHDGEKSISFDFSYNLNDLFLSIDLFEDGTLFRPDSIHEYFIHETSGIINKPIDLELSLKKNKKGDITSTVKITINNVTSELIYSGSTIESLTFYNAERSVIETYPIELIAKKGSFIPTRVGNLVEHKIPNTNPIKRIEINTLEKISTAKINAKLSSSSIKPSASISKKAISSILALGVPSIESLEKKLSKILPKSSLPLSKIMNNDKLFLDTIQVNLLAKNITTIWNATDNLFKNFFSGVRYLGPLRASAERYYRFQDLQIGEIDHTGSNLPMVINSLDNRKKEELSNWVDENFGFKLELLQTGTHYALQIKETNETKFHNISDMGFGYSQILPVIVSIWHELVTSGKRQLSHAQLMRRTKIKSRTLVIEQPELHLHPALQYKFGLAIAKVAKIGKSYGYNFVIETHSKHLIDALGESIQKEELSNEDIEISLFEKNEIGITSTCTAGFDSDGYLTNWPAGFLSPQS